MGWFAENLWAARRPTPSITSLCQKHGKRFTQYWLRPSSWPKIGKNCPRRFNLCRYELKGKGFEVSGYLQSQRGGKVEFHCETKDGKTGQATINGSKYDLSDGELFLVATSGEEVRVKQLKRDMTKQQMDQESLSAFGRADPEIVGFFGKSAQ